MDASKNPVFSDEDFDEADHMGEIRKRPTLMVHHLPKPVDCKHRWPDQEDNYEQDSSCLDCGRSFLQYIFMECP